MSLAPAKPEKVGVVLLNMGGPDSLENIRPFLYNLFSDREIIKLPGPFFMRKFIAGRIAAKRSLKVRERYQAIGGKTPLTEITYRQAEGLEKLLSDSGHPYKTFVAMRYWHPLTSETVKDILKEEITKLIALSLYPHYSRATAGSSVNELKICLAKEKAHLNLTYLDRWFAHPLYIKCLAERIKDGLALFPNEDRNKVKIVYSAHSLPQEFVDQGDPYVGEVKSTIEALKPYLGEVDELLTFQSRSGPVDWVGPDTAEAMVELGKSGTENLLMVPISFVSEHIETLYEMDVMYKEAFLKAGGKRFFRAASFNDRPDFLEFLKALVLEHRKD